METRTCPECSQSFTITDGDLAFYQKINVPPPTLCPADRERRRFAFRNERILYRRTCDMCKASIISIYSPDKKTTVYCQKCWWSDAWDPAQFGRDFDFSKGFFEQFGELLQAVPRAALYNVNGINSDYCQQVYGNKDCYLCFVMKDCESCMHLSHAVKNKDCVDSTHLRESELSYECLDSQHLYNCFFCERCVSSFNLQFCYDMSGCRDCFGCVGLRNKEYHIFNKPYSKEEYLKRVASFGLEKFSEVQKIKQQFIQHKLTFPHRNLWNINTENSSGNNLQNTRNCRECYDSFDLQDCSYCTWIFTCKDLYDCYGVGASELIYDSIGVEEVNNCRFNTFTTNSSDTDYSDSCFSSQHLFGCVGMKKAKYAILNKKYSQEEFLDLSRKIREHMYKLGQFGEFFPMSLSPFCYNETIAQNYYPLTADETANRGLSWKSESATDYKKQTYEIPDSIRDVPDSICQEVLACSSCGKNYKIVPQELKFYRTMGIPIPRKCPNCRYKYRVSQRNSKKLWKRECMKCGVEMQTTYEPDPATARPFAKRSGSKEIVYCEKCYLEAVY